MPGTLRDAKIQNSQKFNSSILKNNIKLLVIFGNFISQK